MFPKVPQSSQTESLGFPRNTPETLGHPGTLKNPIKKERLQLPTSLFLYRAQLLNFIGVKIFIRFSHNFLVGGFNSHPIWKNMRKSNWKSSPILELKIKHIWNHHLVLNHFGFLLGVFFVITTRFGTILAPPSILGGRNIFPKQTLQGGPRVDRYKWSFTWVAPFLMAEN